MLASSSSAERVTIRLLYLYKDTIFFGIAVKMLFMLPMSHIILPGFKSHCVPDYGFLSNEHPSRQWVMVQVFDLQSTWKSQSEFTARLVLRPALVVLSV